MEQLAAPTLLTLEHDTSSFDCGEASLTDWLKRRAVKNQDSGASRTYVVCSGKRVIGYFALATGCVDRANAPSVVARSMPNPIPVIVLARLAVDLGYQRRRLGANLLKDAMLRTLRVANEVGVRALLVHALDGKAKDFYSKYGFKEAVMDPMTLMISVKTMANHL